MATAAAVAVAAAAASEEGVPAPAVAAAAVAAAAADVVRAEGCIRQAVQRLVRASVSSTTMKVTSTLKKRAPVAFAIDEDNSVL